ncbi:MAG: hypothetical protein R3F18_16410 [Lysobacterales bacterium]
MKPAILRQQPPGATTEVAAGNKVKQISEKSHGIPRQNERKSERKRRSAAGADERSSTIPQETTSATVEARGCEKCGRALCKLLHAIRVGMKPTHEANGMAVVTESCVRDR